MTRVLIVEDDSTMVSLIQTLLKMEGYQPLALDSEKDLIQSVHESRPDIVLMDVHLASRNGIEELQRLRNTPDGQQVKVVMISGLDFKDECLSKGANAFLQKPFMPDELIDTLRAMS